MEQSNSFTVNIVVWGENYEVASQLAAKICPGELVDSVYSSITNGVQVKAYLRSPDTMAVSSPIGITDVLIVCLKNKSSELLKNALSYVDQRRGVPIKIFTSLTDDLTDVAKELNGDVTFVPYEKLTSSETRNSLVNRAKNLEDSLKAAFVKLDVNKDGYVTADELVKISKELEHTLNDLEATNIANLMSSNGNISYQDFKKWWVQGKGDFNTFRKLVQVEMSVHSLLKKGSQSFGEYISNMEKEGQVGSTDYTGRLNIGPTEDFEHGIVLDMDIAMGKDFDANVKDFPATYKSSPLIYTLEIHLQNEVIGGVVVQTLESLKQMATSIPQIDQVLQMGLEVNFRHVGTSVFIDFLLNGIIGEMVTSQISKVDFNTINFAGVGNMSIVSGLKLTDLLSKNFEELVESLTSFKVQSHSELSGLRVFLEAYSHIYDGISAQFPKKVKFVIGMLKYLNFVREFSYEFKYDRKELKNLVLETLGFAFAGQLNQEGALVAVQGLSGQLEQYQAMAGGMLEGGQLQPLLDGFLGPFIPSLQEINFDRITLGIALYSLKFGYKISLNLLGLTEFLKEKIFSQCSQ